MSKLEAKNLVFLVYLVLAAAIVVCFRQVRNFDFINYDDNNYVYENQHVLGGLTRDGIAWAFTTGHAANWHPLTWLSLMSDYQLFGSNPGWFHLVNVFLHIANALLLFAVLKKMTDSLWPSAFVAAAFALHPLHVESVAWISERKDVLSTLFWLLTLAAYASYVKRPTAIRYLVTLVIFAAGLLAKPMLVTLPFVLLLLDYWPLNRLMPQTIKTVGRQLPKSAAADRRAVAYRLIIEKVPFFVLAAVSSVITFLVQRSGGAVPDVALLPLKTRVANAFLSYARYMEKMAWPQNLTVFYPFDADSFPFWQIALCAALLLGISFFVVRLGRNHKYLPVGWFWFVGTLIPVIGLVQVGNQAFADRYTYIPYIGLFIMIAWGIPDLLRVTRPVGAGLKPALSAAVVGVSMLVVLTALGICTYRQSSYWKNSPTLFSHALEVTQNNFVAYYGLADYWRKQGKVALAIEYFKKAIQIKPASAIAHGNLGEAFLAERKFKDALGQVKRALEIEPNNPEAKNNLAWILAASPDPNLRNPSEAVRVAKEACSLTNHQNPGVLDTLAAAYASGGRFPEAIETAQKALSLVGQDDKDLRHTIQHRMDLYRASKPYIDVPQKTENTGQK
jgi:Flp pilus assembly protein TadD